MRITRSLPVVLLTILLGVAGCSDDDENTGSASLTWRLQNINTGAAVSCAAGDVVRVQLADQVDVFDCSAFAAVTSSVPAGTYTARVELLDASGRILSAADVPIVIQEDATIDMGDVLFLVE